MINELSDERRLATFRCLTGMVFLIGRFLAPVRPTFVPHQFGVMRISVGFEATDFFAIDVVVRFETVVAQVARIVGDSVAVGCDPPHGQHGAHHAVTSSTLLQTVNSRIGR